MLNCDNTEEILETYNPWMETFQADLQIDGIIVNINDAIIIEAYLLLESELCRIRWSFGKTGTTRLYEQRVNTANDYVVGNVDFWSETTWFADSEYNWSFDKRLVHECWIVQTYRDRYTVSTKEKLKQLSYWSSENAN